MSTIALIAHTSLLLHTNQFAKSFTFMQSYINFVCVYVVSVDVLQVINSNTY